MTVVNTAGLIGCKPYLLNMEIRSSQGVPKIVVLGLSAKKAYQMKNRVLSALDSLDFKLKSRRTLVNFNPAATGKNSRQLELGLAVGLLQDNQFVQKDLSKCLFVGALDLSGQIKPVRGILSYIKLAKHCDLKHIIIPEDNYQQAQLASGVELISVRNLKQLIAWLDKDKKPEVQNSFSQEQSIQENSLISQVKLQDIVGQNTAKRALAIALAGRHHLLMVGPPGTGKSLLSRAAASITPNLNHQQQLETTQIHSLTDQSCQQIIINPPVRLVGAGISRSCLFGGGRYLKPGEVSLAHYGILLMDELPHFSQSLLTQLSQVLQNKTIQLKNRLSSCLYPANLMLIATMNPCPCGFYQTNIKPCSCGPSQRQRYLGRLTGALLDRIDVCTYVSPVAKISQSCQQTGKTSQEIKRLVSQAWETQNQRYSQYFFQFNSELESYQLKEFVKLSCQCRQLLEQAISKLKLSTRARYQVIRVARTIADLEQSKFIKPCHVQEALGFTVEKNFMSN